MLPGTRHLLLAASLLAPGFAVPAGSLAIERVDLGDSSPGLQAYNLQETVGARVFARSEAGFKRSQVFVQWREGEGWGAAQPMAFSDPRWRDSDPHLSPDGQRLTFVSDRPAQGEAPLGPLDLFESRRGADGRWTTPSRLPEALQSTSYELGPERHGEVLYFSSARPGGPGRLSIYQSTPDRPAAAPQPLPSPINEGSHDSDFTLTPDGRFALWWSHREGTAGPGDLYLAERQGERFGPARRLPEPVNGPGLEFTPSVSADGQWLFFASTGDQAEGLSHVYRTRWPELLRELGLQPM